MVSDSSRRSLGYPDAPHEHTVMMMHGVEVADPYRSLENLNAPETQAWIEAENDLTHDYLTHFPDSEALHQQLTELWNFEKYGGPWKREERFFTSNAFTCKIRTYSTGGQRLLQNRWCYLTRMKSHRIMMLSWWDLRSAKMGAGSPMAFSEAGSDWQEWRIREVETGQDLDDSLCWIKFFHSIQILDNQGLFYARLNEPTEGLAYEEINLYQKLYFHRLGTAQSADTLVYERPETSRTRL